MSWWVQAFLGIVFKTRRFQIDLAYSRVEVLSTGESSAVSISNSGDWESETAALWEQQRMKQMHREKQEQNRERSAWCLVTLQSCIQPIPEKGLLPCPILWKLSYRFLKQNKTKENKTLC